MLGILTMAGRWLKILRHPRTGKRFKMGRLRPPVDSPKLHLRDYLDQASLPTPPAACDYSPLAAAALKQIYGNDQLGDCVIAGMAHLQGVFTGNANGGSPVLLTDAEIIALYSAIGGYLPGDPSTDNGCDEATALAYWEKNGLFPGGDGKIAGRISIDASNVKEIQAALWLFENLYFGVELPDGWISPMPSGSGFTWDVAGDPDPENGHCFVGVAYDDDGVTIDTWGMLGKVTWAAIAKYASTAGAGELYAVLSPDAIARATQKAPNGFAFAQLQADLAALGAVAA